MTVAELAPARTLKNAFPWGALQGRVELPPALVEQAKLYAAEVYKAAEAENFSGDEVQNLPLAPWLPKLESWFPTQAVKAFGFEVNTKFEPLLLATAGVDPHEDDIHGAALILVLYNDGLTFSQGKQRHRTAAGEWFIFNDHKAHSVRESRASTVYLCLSVPLRALA